jgi:hypothetical protein
MLKGSAPAAAAMPDSLIKVLLFCLFICNNHFIRVAI